jgi:hypothetical protein
LDALLIFGITGGIIRGLPGRRTVADHKTVHGRRLDMIGWVVDLDAYIVSIAQHNP